MLPCPCIAAEVDEIIKVIAEQVEEDRRQKQSINYANQYTQESGLAQLIAPTQNIEKEAKETRTKVAKMFDTNRQYVSDAIKLKAVIGSGVCFVG